jgi:SpoVK/Ycf46/Vps4 family AAA+-type ATPase
MYRLMNAQMEMLNSSKREDAAGLERRARLLAKLKAAGRSDAQAQFVANLKPSKYELAVLADVVFADEIGEEFRDVGGHAKLKRDLYESIILPLQQPALFRQMHASSPLLAMPRGALFYGPPGVGKTMLGKAIAKASGATFINVRMSSLQTKWFGESQKLVRAVFQVAQQYAPSIIFVDECESFMRKRGSSFENEGSATMRTEWLSLWDGLLTASRNAQAAAPDGGASSNVMVLCCCNRPWDIDAAFLRRMPRTFLLPLPSQAERVDILTLLLRDSPVTALASSSSFSSSSSSSAAAPASATERAAFITELAHQTAGYSGSDLKEACRVAAGFPLRAMIKKHTQDNFEQLMHGREPTAATPSSSAAAAASASSVANAAIAALSASPDSSPESPVTTAAASASSSSSSAAGQKPRPLRMSDFHKALRAVRPTGQASMRELLLFEQQHRGSLDSAFDAHRNVNANGSTGSNNLRKPGDAAASDIDDEDDDEDDDDDEPNHRRRGASSSNSGHGGNSSDSDRGRRFSDNSSDDGIYD